MFFLSNLVAIGHFLSNLSKFEQIYGRAIIINVIALSQLLYNMNKIATPEYVLKEVETCIYDFLWKGKKRQN